MKIVKAQITKIEHYTSCLPYSLFNPALMLTEGAVEVFAVGVTDDNKRVRFRLLKSSQLAKVIQFMNEMAESLADTEQRYVHSIEEATE